MHNEKTLKKEEVDRYFHILSKEIKKEYGRKARFEVIVVGGVSVMLNYGFRESTTDVDAIISRGGSLKAAAYRTAEQCGLDDEWLNEDFRKTKSYSPALVRVSKPYKAYNQVLEVRTVKDEYLMAMKLISFRPYKYDKSDIVGIHDTMKAAGHAPSIEAIQDAFMELYGSLDAAPPGALEYAKKVCGGGVTYQQAISEEQLSRAFLKDFAMRHPNTLNPDNFRQISDALMGPDSIGPICALLDAGDASGAGAAILGDILDGTPSISCPIFFQYLRQGVSPTCWGRGIGINNQRYQ